MGLIHTIQQQDNPIQEGILNLSVPIIDRIGEGWIVYPNSYWLNGKTFYVGDVVDTTNNQLYCIEYDYVTGWTFKYVGIGTYTNDVFDHPAGYLVQEGGYIYCGQTNTHGDPIDVWKTNSAGTISGGFFKANVVPGNNAYLNPHLTVYNKYCFATRGTGFDFYLQISDTSSIEGTFTARQITNTDYGTSNYRHYFGTAQKYGTNTIDVYIINWRNDTGQHYFGNCLLKTSDGETFEDYDETFSKNVVSTSPITNAELDTNFAINGTTSSDTADLRAMQGILINDVFYGISVKSGTTDHYIWKLSGTTLTDTQVTISNLNHDFLNPIMYYDGTDILLSVCIDDGVTKSKKIYKVPLDLSDFTDVVYTYEPETMYEGTRPIMLPQNYNDLSTGDYYAMYLDRNKTTDEMIVDIKNSLL